MISLKHGQHCSVSTSDQPRVVQLGQYEITKSEAEIHFMEHSKRNGDVQDVHIPIAQAGNDLLAQFTQIEELVTRHNN